MKIIQWYRGLPALHRALFALGALAVFAVTLHLAGVGGSSALFAMMLSFEFNFDPTPKAGVTAAANSTNVYDAGSAKKLFDGTGTPFRISGFYKANSGTNPTFRIQFVGADDAALTTNILTIVETGTSPVLVAGTVVPFELIPQFQATAKRFYGLIYTPAGTTPNIDVMAVGVIDGQSAFPVQKAAVP